VSPILAPIDSDTARRAGDAGLAMDPHALEAELKRLRPLAEMGRMAATVAHEIRNPLTGISANAELLRESVGDPADIESVDIILAECERLGRLVTDPSTWCGWPAPPSSCPSTTPNAPGSTSIGPATAVPWVTPT